MSDPDSYCIIHVTPSINERIDHRWQRNTLDDDIGLNTQHINRSRIGFDLCESTVESIWPGTNQSDPDKISAEKTRDIRFETDDIESFVSRKPSIP